MTRMLKQKPKSINRLASIAIEVLQVKIVRENNLK